MSTLPMTLAFLVAMIFFAIAYCSGRRVTTIQDQTEGFTQ
jgi:hypothetical protein